VCVATVVLVTSTTDFMTLTRALRKIRAPSLFVSIIFTTYRYVFLTLHEVYSQLLANVDIVPYIADRVYLLNDGRILAEGGTAEVFSNFKLLESCRLEAPMIARLFRILREQAGVELGLMPMTMEEGIKELRSLEGRPNATGR